jgi:predicted CoA-binding protein
MAAINDTRLREILTSSPTIAVLGVHHEPEKAAFYVPEYLHDEGYRIIGVNPQFVGHTIFDEPVRATLAEIGEPIDLVNVFRSAEFIDGVVDECIALKLKALWIQEGIVNEPAALRARAAGIAVVMDRCIYRDYVKECA